MPSPGELEIFRHALDGVVEEMGVTLQRTAYSTNIKIRRDHTCAWFDADCRHVAQHDVAPQHIGSLVSVVPRIVADRGGDLEPGDGLLVNDPDLGAVHLPDVMLISPIAAEGDIVGYAANSAHHVDIGGPTPGGIPNDSTELYAEGLIVPGIRAVRNWEFDPEILDLITRNVRGAETRRGDYRAQLGANRIGARRYRELCEEYGGDRLKTFLDALLDYTERRVRAAIADLPDGEYRAVDDMDGDGIDDAPRQLALTLTIDGEALTIDFTGTAEQSTGPLNCTPAMAFAGAMAVVMALLGGDLPKNDGFYRPIDTVTPEGTMVNPGPNAPVAGGWELAMRAGDLVTRALADALPEETIAAAKGTVCNLAYAGRDPRDDEPYVFYETVAGGYGARASKDGMEAVQAHFQNTANSPIEELEAEIPVHVRRYELITDSGGAGRNRGGLGIRRDMQFHGHDASFSVLADRATGRPWGLFGGRPGRSARYVLNPDGDDPIELGSKATVTLDPDAVASVQTPGGGGYGDPLERDPERVLADVSDEKVTIGAARAEYGVVLDPDTGSIDADATERRREAVRSGGVDE